MNNQYAKSCIRVYNDTAQAFTAALTPLNLEGNSCCKQWVFSDPEHGQHPS